MNNSWRQRELVFLLLYAVVFYIIIIYYSLQLSHDHYRKLYGLRPGLISSQLNDASDAQWRNFRSNLPILTFVFGLFTLFANVLRAFHNFKAEGMSIAWLLISLAYLSYLHGAFIIFILSIASANFLLVKIFGRTKYFPIVLWVFNLSFLLCNRVYEGYSFASFGNRWAYLDKYRGTFRWHICFNFVVLRMISFGYDYHWSDHNTYVDQEKHIRHCPTCSSGKTCYRMLQERSVGADKFSYTLYLCYLLFAPLYIAGPIISFNAFASQLDTPQKSNTLKQIVWYGFRWVLSLFLMEIMTHFFYYNAFAISGIWKQLSPMEVFIVGYGVRAHGPKLHVAQVFPHLALLPVLGTGGSRRKLLNVWVVFTFVAVWHDLEWKLLSWAWLTCIFFIPEMLVKSAATSFKVDSDFREFVFRELRAVAGAITITCLMVANLVGFVIGPSGISWLKSVFLQAEGLPTLCGLLVTFYIGTKLMFHVSDSKQRTHQS